RATFRSPSPARCATRFSFPSTEGKPMKLAYFDDYHLGVINGDNVVDVSGLVKDIPHTGPHNLISGLIERFADYRGKLEDAATRGKGVPIAQVKLRSPLPMTVYIQSMERNS